MDGKGESILQSISKKRTSSGKKKTATTFGELKKVSQVKKIFGIDEMSLTWSRTSVSTARGARYSGRRLQNRR
jgi:hypothetical protein